MHKKNKIYQLIAQCLSNTTSVAEREEIDKRISSLLQLNEEEIEQSIENDSAREELYQSNLSALALNTSYTDLYTLLEKIHSKKSNASICDVGAGHCRMALIANLFFPTLKVVSVEPVEERIKHAQILLKHSEHIFHTEYFENISKITISDFYFFYFPTGNIWENILSEIKKYSHSFSIIAIESHGELFNRLNLEKSWLQCSPFFELTYPRHNRQCNKYKKISTSKNTLEQLYQSIQFNPHIIIEDSWCADTEGLELHFDHPEEITFEFKFPPRTLKFNLSETKKLKFLKESGLDEQTKKYVQMRKGAQSINGLEIRKIFIYKRELELSNGKLISY